MLSSAKAAIAVVCALSALDLLGCGSAPPATSAAAEPEAPRASRGAPATDAPAPLGGGSSDGTTCEEARDSHPDEVGVGARQDGPEPSDAEFSGPLSHGSYLDDCEVTSDTRVSVCAAITQGKAVGVTVATSPSDPDKEKCVAARVRDIAIPSHPRLRVVRTSF
jgi:hypothetical protein